MKKSLLVMLLAVLSFFMFAGISQAGQCIYLVSTEDWDYYYDPSEAQYSGDIVSFVSYDNDACEADELDPAIEIDCARRMLRIFFEGWGEWDSFSPGSPAEAAMQQLCR